MAGICSKILWDGGNRWNKSAQKLIIVEAECLGNEDSLYYPVHFCTCFKFIKKVFFNVIELSSVWWKCVLVWRSGTGGAGIWEEGLEQPLWGECQGMYETNKRVAEQLQGPSWNWTAWIHIDVLGSLSRGVLGLQEQKGTMEAGVPDQ